MKSMNPRMLSHIQGTGLPIRTEKAGHTWYRIHRTKLHPLWFGPAPGEAPANRFDDPQREYRVCYLGYTVEASFAETLLRNPPRRILSTTDLSARSVTALQLLRPIRLVPIHGNGLARLGLTADIIHGSYDDCGLLARMLWEHPDAPDGLEYRSRHDDEQLCIALFDRADDALAVTQTSGLMHDKTRLVGLLKRYDVGLNP